MSLPCRLECCEFTFCFHAFSAKSLITSHGVVLLENECGEVGRDSSYHREGALNEVAAKCNKNVFENCQALARKENESQGSLRHANHQHMTYHAKKLSSIPIGCGSTEGHCNVYAPDILSHKPAYYAIQV
mmetsp:Transcript_28158/g.46645  ORF Transcript_28158/g.46645 Transcript_28158/m.46645 type:complete len:130 (+) Transcript_28158:504-893(+)